MSYIRESLAANEHVVALFPLHWSMWLGFWAIVVLGVVATLASAVAFAPLAIVVLTIAAVAALLEFLRLRAIEQGVTNHRVIRKTGVIARNTTELRLASIETVDLRQSIWGRLLGFGDVQITGRGETAMLLRRIADPVGVKRAIETAYSANVESLRTAPAKA